MSKFRSWVYRCLIAIGIGGLITSWLLPWWGCYIIAIGMDDKIVIHPYGLWEGLGGWGGMLGDMAAMPGFFTPLMWCYFGLCIGALIFTMWKMNTSIRLIGRNFSLSGLVVGLVGFSYAAVILIFYLYAKMRVGDLGVEFIGMTYINPTPMIHTYAYTGYRDGLWVACGASAYLFVLAWLKNIIVGRAKATPANDAVN
jgi:hypothetical protein